MLGAGAGVELRGDLTHLPHLAVRCVISLPPECPHCHHYCHVLAWLKVIIVILITYKGQLKVFDVITMISCKES